MSDAWLSAKEAQRRLGVKPQTLYAYVSRGRVTVRPDPANPRRSVYAAADIARLGAGKDRSRTGVARQSLSFGAPVLHTSLCRIEAGKLYYRDQSVESLALGASLEDVAQLLWDAEADPFSALPPTPIVAAGPTPLQRAFSCLTQHAGQDPPQDGSARGERLAQAALIFSELADAMIGAKRIGLAHQRLHRFWRLDADRADLIRVCLVVCADHELNASTFAARVAASTGASLAACTLAGLATLTGPRHGGQTVETGVMISECLKSADPAGEARRRLAESGHALGFGHPLYPAGDPRARLILERTPLTPELEAVLAALREETGEEPNLDFALACAARSMRLPLDAAFTLFALGRSVGWIAHALEQAEHPAVIRPRARFLGRPTIPSDPLSLPE